MTSLERLDVAMKACSEAVRVSELPMPGPPSGPHPDDIVPKAETPLPKQREMPGPPPKAVSATAGPAKAEMPAAELVLEATSKGVWDSRVEHVGMAPLTPPPAAPAIPCNKAPTLRPIGARIAKPVPLTPTISKASLCGPSGSVPAPKKAKSEAPPPQPKPPLVPPPAHVLSQFAPPAEDDAFEDISIAAPDANPAEPTIHLGELDTPPVPFVSFDMAG